MILFSFTLPFLVLVLLGYWRRPKGERVGVGFTELQMAKIADFVLSCRYRSSLALAVVTT